MVRGGCSKIVVPGFSLPRKILPDKRMNREGVKNRLRYDVFSETQNRKSQTRPAILTVRWSSR